MYRRNAAARAAADELYLYGGGLTPELAQPINPTFRGVHLPAYLRREISPNSDGKMRSTAPPKPCAAQAETVGSEDSGTGQA